MVVFTDTYPYGSAENTFLDPELEHLRSAFGRVIIVPAERQGERVQLPPGIEVDETYAISQEARLRKLRTTIDAAASPAFARELRTNLSVAADPRLIKRLVSFVGRAESVRRWVPTFLRRHEIESVPCVCYTYWFDSTTFGLGLARTDHPNLRLVSRAHGYDLYEDRHTPPYIPCRPRALSLLDGVFPDSDAGREYLEARYPGTVGICETARLGVPDPGFVTAPSNDEIFRLFSCSFIVPVKRLELLAAGLAVAARRRPEQSFQWHHFGDGPLREALEKQVETEMPPNVAIRFLGYPGQPELMRYYRDEPVDLFVNLSASEGTPVAVMEAASCGIPVLATAVGGNPEIVRPENGFLLPADPSAEQVGSEILSVLDARATLAEKRQGSRNVWRERFDSYRNYADFAERLISISGPNASRPVDLVRSG